jgi:hypothetical protein
MQVRYTPVTLNNTMSTSFSGQALATSDLQTEVATALRDFYNFLARLPWLEPSDILEPPAQGWPNITSDNFAPLHKNNAVIELLRHLPYLRMDGPFERYTLVWSTYPCDYRRDYFHEVKPGIDCWEIPDTTGRDYHFPEWVVPLTYGKVHGQYIMLDTTDGIYKFLLAKTCFLVRPLITDRFWSTIRHSDELPSAGAPRSSV